MRNVVRGALVVLVGASWALPWGLLAFVLGWSQGQVASLAAFTIGFVGTVTACWLCVRLLTHSPPRWWLVIAVACGVASLALQYTLLWTVGLVDHQLSGPASPSGLSVIVGVRDAHPGLSADFYCDVRVLDANGSVVAAHACGSQDQRDGPELLRDSMRWTSPRTLEFTTRCGPERLILR